MREMHRSVAGRATGHSQRSTSGARAPGSKRHWAWEWIKSFLIAFGLFLVIRTFLVEAFRIPTGSMENTLLVGDFLLVNKATFGAGVPFTDMRLPALAQPRRGDIIVFIPPHEDGKNYVKRLVGLPGDTLGMENGALFINGLPVDEPYVRHSGSSDVYSAGMFWQCDYSATIGDACRPTRDNWGPLVVPAGRYFMLGDNRDDSEDSRYWGFVPREGVKGRPLFIYYSFEPGTGSAPWLTAIRWHRLGSRVH
jgi:signal peptidase I